MEKDLDIGLMSEQFQKFIEETSRQHGISEDEFEEILKTFLGE